MSEKPVFSVIIPTYNRKELLSNAINSVLTQSFENYEIIIVDDGSNDDTFSLVYGLHNDRIIYVYKKNGGQNSANNIGIRLAKGDYIAFLDSDDEWTERKLEKTYQKFMSDPELSIVYNLTGIMKDNEVVLARNDVVEGWCYKEVLEQGYLTSPSFLVCKKECFDELGDLDELQRCCQDDDLCIRLSKKFKVGLIKEILGIYGVSANDQITKDKKKGAVFYLRLLEKYKDEILRECGKETMLKKYNRAKRLFNEVGDADSVRSIENKMRELD